MKNYRFYVEYDGTRYLGWQRLGKNQFEKSIQGKIELVLSKLYDLPVEEINLIASGRTDAGVHAKAQVANVHLPDNKPMSEIESYCNRYLPEDIRIFGLEEVEDRFHSRFSAKQKEYHYRISLSKPSVFEKNYIWYLESELDFDKIKKAAQLLIGEHDFFGFSSLKKTKKSTVREIYNIEILKEENSIVFIFTGNGFLQNMIRIIMGTLIEIGEGKKDVDSIILTLNSKKRENAGFLAPAKGLILYKVSY